MVGPAPQVALLDAHSLKALEGARQIDVGGPVTDLKFAPDGSLLAAASRDRGIYVFSTKEFKQLGVCRGHSAAVLHMDFSADSGYLRSTCAACELLFWDPERGARVTDLKRMAALEWASETCTFGWAVQGTCTPAPARPPARPP
eukprot:tig00000178_g12748.t1